MAALTVERFLAMLPLEDAADALSGPLEGVGVTELCRAFVERRDDFLSTPVIAALRTRYADGLGGRWPEIEESLERDLRDAYGPPTDNDWTPLIGASEILLSLWGPPGAFIEYATEYRLLELHDDDSAQGDRLFVLFLFDERDWSHAPEVIEVADDLPSIHAEVAGLLVGDYGGFLREHDPSITFFTSIPDALLWSSLDRIIGPSFDDWARAFRGAVEQRDWVKREFLQQRAAGRLRLEDGDGVRRVIEPILTGDSFSPGDLPSNAHDIVRAAYWACWEGYEWAAGLR